MNPSSPPSFPSTCTRNVNADLDWGQTNIGFVLISMNPYKDTGIYTEGVLEDYIGKRYVLFVSV